MTSPTHDDWIEIVRSDHPPGPFRAAIFDFDGTLSLLRRNWQDTMIPMMVEVLQAETETRESETTLRAVVEEFVMRLNGKQTIYQMIQLCEEIRRRGGQPQDPLEYKRQYHDRLWRHVRSRIEGIESGRVSATAFTVPGARSLLRELVGRGLVLYLASGTDRDYVVNEVEVLGLRDFFGPRIYGALDDYKRFSKAMVLGQIIEETGVRGDQIVAFGDGFVEIEETVRVGGLAIGVASQENGGGGINEWKRSRLIQAGAHWIIADYAHPQRLAALLSEQSQNSR